MVYIAEHLAAINKIYPISSPCCATYLLALGCLSFLRMHCVARSGHCLSFIPRDKVRVRTSESSNSTKKEKSLIVS